MKFGEDNVKEAVIVGEIKKNSVSIDTSNLDFIVTILSTNLYSEPIESFVRETVSNGWDSHIEAGVSDPVVLELGINTEDEYYCRIQDFGVGLSEERFNNIYRNIGSSTKRDTNDQIGGFGIGRFSALAYSDIVHITSVYEGEKTLYLMYKDGNSINIDVLHKSPTRESNGVCVEVKIKKESDISSFIAAINNQLVYFENLYVLDNLPERLEEEKELIAKFNEVKIKKYDNFLVNSLPSKPTNNVFNNVDIVIGKVRYPVNSQLIPTEYQMQLLPKFWSNFPVSLKFEIGELQVTPNREQVQYSEKAIKKIGEKAVDTSNELRSLVKSYVEKDFTSLSAYVKAIEDTIEVPLLISNEEVLKTARFPNSSRKTTLNGVKYDEETFTSFYQHMSYRRIPVSLVSTNNKVSSKSGVLTNISTIKARFNYVYFANLSTLDYYSKAYIREELKNCIFLPLEYKSRLLKLYKRLYKEYEDLTLKNTAVFTNGRKVVLRKFDSKIFKIIFLDIVKNLSKRPTISTMQSIPKSFIDKKKAEQLLAKANRVHNAINWKENINIGVLRQNQRDYRESVTQSKTISFEKLKESYKKKLVVYAEKGNTKIRGLFSTIRIDDYTKIKSFNNIDFIEVAPSKLKLLKDMENFIHLDSFLSTDYKGIRKLGTVNKILKEFPDLLSFSSIHNLDKISLKLSTTLKVLSNYCRDVKTYDKDLLQEIEDLCEVTGYYDLEMLAIFNENLDLLNKSRFLIDFIDNITYQSNKTISDKKLPVLLDYILARKLFPVNYETLNKIKNESNQD